MGSGGTEAGAREWTAVYSLGTVTGSRQQLQPREGCRCVTHLCQGGLNHSSG